MSYSEALKFAEGAERARDLAWARKCEEEDRAIEEYNDFCNHLENEFKEFKAKYENKLKCISLEELHNYLISRYEEKDFDFEPFESLVLDYIEGTKAWEDWGKKILIIQMSKRKSFTSSVKRYVIKWLLFCKK